LVTERRRARPPLLQEGRLSAVDAFARAPGVLNGPGTVSLAKEEDAPRAGEEASSKPLAVQHREPRPLWQDSSMWVIRTDPSARKRALEEVYAQSVQLSPPTTAARIVLRPDVK